MDPCARRERQIATIYHVTHVWRGVDPGRIENGQLSIVESGTVLEPRTKGRVIGDLSGPAVVNARNEGLDYNVWAPIEVVRAP